MKSRSHTWRSKCYRKCNCSCSKRFHFILESKHRNVKFSILILEIPPKNKKKNNNKKTYFWAWVWTMSHCFQRNLIIYSYLQYNTTCRKQLHWINTCIEIYSSLHQHEVMLIYLEMNPLEVIECSALDNPPHESPNASIIHISHE